MKKIIMAAAVVATALLTSCEGSTPKPTLKTSEDTLSYEMGFASSYPEDELKAILSDPRTGSDSTYIEEFLKGVREGLQGADDKKQAAYLAGLNFGMNYGSMLKQTGEYIFANDSTKKLSTKNFIAGFKACLNNRTALKIDGKLVDKDAARLDAQQRIRTIAAASLAKRYEKERAAADSFITAKSKEEGVKKLPNGTLYKVVKEGTGEKATKGQTVNVIYEGRLTDGTVFDKSAQHPGPDGQSLPMVIGNSIPGFDEALQAMPFGSTWEIYIPYDQAYNEQGGGQIKPFSALIFTVTLVGLYDNQATK